MCGDCARRSPSALSRRDFMKLGGLGIAGASLVGVMGSGSTIAQVDSDLSSEFEAAAQEFNVPVEILIAMGWVNTRWEMPSPKVNEYEEGNLHGMGLYGIMALVQNPSSDTLGEASKLTGISEDMLKSNRAANIRGGAALLAKARQTVNVRAANGLNRALEAVEGSSAANEAIAGVGGGELYQEQVLEALKSGVAGVTNEGERIELAPQRGVG
jgi:hypothetical protein